MKYYSSTILALAVTAMTGVVGNTPGVHGWSLGRGPSSLFFNSPLVLLDEEDLSLEPSDAFISPSSMMSKALERQRQLARSMMLDRPVLSPLTPLKTMLDQPILSSLTPLKSSSPWRYELINDDEKFQLSVDVPGVEMKDLDVSIDEANGYVTVSGQRTVSSTNDETGSSSRYSSKFSQTFALDDAVDLEQLTANLKNGVLVVTAPRDLKRVEETVKRIPITGTDDTPLAAVESSDVGEDEVLDLDKDDEKHPIPTIDEEKSKIHHVRIKNEGEQVATKA
jgi:HSP20 family molecular chaperone IbpA